MKTAEELEAAFGQLGARATIGASAERMQLTGHCLKKNLPQVVQLIKEMLLEPRWDEEAMELAKTRMRESIHQSVTTPKTIVRNVFRRKFRPCLFEENLYNYFLLRDRRKVFIPFSWRI